MYLVLFKAHQHVYIICGHVTITSFSMMAAEEPPAKKARVHFGAGEDPEKKKTEQAGVRVGGGVVAGNGAVSEAVLAGIRAGNINIADGAHYLEHAS